MNTLNSLFGLGRPLSAVPADAPHASLGKRIRAARLAARLTLEEVAARTKGAVTYSGLARYERGEFAPSLARLSAIAEALGTTVSALTE